MYVYIYIYIDMYIIHTYTYMYTLGISKARDARIVRPISLLILSLLILADSTFQGYSLWAGAFRPLTLRLCSSQTFRHPEGLILRLAVHHMGS